MSPQTDTLELLVNRRTVTLALQWLDAIGHREQWPMALKFSLTISLDEALTNVVCYAFNHSLFLAADDRTKPQATPCMILLRCLIWPTRIQVEMIDNGIPYDPTKATTPALPASVENARLGGLGLRLMRHYLSDISYSRRGDKNYLILSANIGLANDA